MSFQSPSLTPHKKSGFVLFVCGLCMGAADLIPGISGGTIAFLMGFYHPLIESIKSLDREAFKLLISFQFRSFFNKVAWRFLLSLGSGMAVAILSLAGIFHLILQHEIYRVYLYASFMGLIIASFIYCIRQITNWNRSTALALGLGMLLAYLGTSAPWPSGQTQAIYAIKIEREASPVPISNYDSERQLLTGLSGSTLHALQAKGMINSETMIYTVEGSKIGPLLALESLDKSSSLNIWLIGCGMIAVCAMLLPGISGSYILTLLGAYPIVIAALADFTSHARQLIFDYEAFTILFNLLIGILIGIFSFSRVISWLLKIYPNGSIAALSGCMIGALPSVWPFWSYKYELLPLSLQKGAQLVAVKAIWPAFSWSLVFPAFACALLGCALVFFIEYSAQPKVVLR